MKPEKDRRLSDTIRILRWAIIIGIFAVVAGYLWAQESWLNLGSGERIGYGILIYGCFGSLVTWLALSWVGSRIAEGEKAQRSVAEHEEYIATVASASADAILSLDPQNMIMSWNAGAELIFGYKGSEMVGRHISTLLPEDILESGELERLAKQIEENSYVRNFETERLTKDGRRIPVEVTQTALVDGEGNLRGYSKIVRDITERKQAEELQRKSYEALLATEREIRELNLELEERIAHRTRSLREAYQELETRNEELRSANERLKELDRMKSEFVSMVSHALRAPVTNIDGAIELLSQIDAADDTECSELIHVLQAESARLSRLVTGILTISRLEGGKLEIKKVPVDIWALAERIIENAAATTDTHSVRFYCTDDLPPVWADPDYTEEVLVSLVDNAIKYSPSGGNIDVRSKVHGDHVITSVRDQGLGIRDGDMQRIFDRFYRVDGSDSGLVGGFGLGLYISKRLIEVQGGWMEAKSSIGEGSTFTFALPIAGNQNKDMEKK